MLNSKGSTFSKLSWLLSQECLTDRTTFRSNVEYSAINDRADVNHLTYLPNEFSG